VGTGQDCFWLCGRDKRHDAVAAECRRPNTVGLCLALCGSGRAAAGIGLGRARPAKYGADLRLRVLCANSVIGLRSRGLPLGMGLLCHSGWAPRLCGLALLRQ